MPYIEKTLASGRAVFLRPLTWEEFWQLSEMRIKATQDMAAIPDTDAAAKQLELLRLARESREQPLTWCVKDFADLQSVTVREVKELEHLINVLSEGPVREGNSVLAAAPTATATA